MYTQSCRRIMNDHKIDFIICYSSQECLNKCIACINSLKIPEGYETEILGLENVSNIENGYMAIMQESDAKYKVYIRENTYIVNDNFLCDVIDSFQRDSQIGMIGVLGEIGEGLQYGQWNVGRISVCNDVRETDVFEMNEVNGTYVDALFGAVLVTNCDLPWNVNAQDDGHYFDIDHSIEMKKNGLKLYVPYQDRAWCIYEKGSSVYDRNDVFTGDCGCRYFLPNHKPKADPLVSVILPVHNGGTFVHDTIMSVVDQTYKNIQIIIIDDCSTDDSREIINQINDSRIETIYLEKNCNVCVASNLGYEKAIGKYIALIGHDDIWHSRKLEEQIAFMELFTEIGVSFTSCDIIDQNGEICTKNRGKEFASLFNQQNKSREEWVSQLFFSNNCLCAPSSVIRKCLINDQLYHVGLIQLQDYALWFRILKQSSIYILHQRLIRYRRFFEDTRNLSTPTRKRVNRTWHETIYIKNAFLRDMDDETFTLLFRKHMIFPSAKSHDEIQCEKAFLLKRINICTCIDVFLNLFNNSTTCHILEEQYGFTLADFYEYNQTGLSFDQDYEFEMEETRQLLLRCEKVINQLTKN